MASVAERFLAVAASDEYIPQSSNGARSAAETWEAALDSASGNIYFHNRSTGATTWELPASRAISPLPTDWVEVIGSEGTYYYNQAAQLTQWERPEVQSAFEESVAQLKKPAVAAKASADAGEFVASTNEDDLSLENAASALSTLRTRALNDEQTQRCLCAIHKHIETADAKNGTQTSSTGIAQVQHRKMDNEMRMKLVDGEVVTLVPLAMRAHDSHAGAISCGCHVMELVLIADRKLINQAIVDGALLKELLLMLC